MGKMSKREGNNDEGKKEGRRKQQGTPTAADKKIEIRLWQEEADDAKITEKRDVK